MNYDDWKATDPNDANYCRHGKYQGEDCEGCDPPEPNDLMDSPPEPGRVWCEQCRDSFPGTHGEQPRQDRQQTRGVGK